MENIFLNMNDENKLKEKTINNENITMLNNNKENTICDNNIFNGNIKSIEETINLINKFKKISSGDSLSLIELLDKNGKMKNALTLLKTLPNIMRAVGNENSSPSKDDIKTNDNRKDNKSIVDTKNSDFEQIVTFNTITKDNKKEAFNIIQ